MGHLHLLWWWALDYAQDGDLADFSADDLAGACEWEGDADVLQQALCTAGFLVGGRLHDWADYGGKYVKRQHQARERQQRHRAQQARDGSANATPEHAPKTHCHADVTRDSALPDRDTSVSHAATREDKIRPENSPAGENARERATPSLPGPNVRSFVPNAGMTQLPRDWKPSDEDLAYARKFGLTDDQVMIADELFRQHQWEHGNGSADWGASWRKWMVREVKGGPGAPRLPPLSERDLPPMTEAERAADKAHRDDLERQRKEHLAQTPSVAERRLQDATADPARPPNVDPEQWMTWSPNMRERMGLRT